MLDETPPAGAERRANGQLTLAAGAADQHHARDVQAHDQEHGSARPSRTPNTRRDSGRPAAPIEEYGSTVAALNSLDAGYRCARPETVADTSPFARVMSTPG